MGVTHLLLLLAIVITLLSRHRGCCSGVSVKERRRNFNFKFNTHVDLNHVTYSRLVELQVIGLT